MNNRQGKSFVYWQDDCVLMSRAAADQSKFKELLLDYLFLDSTPARLSQLRSDMRMLADADDRLHVLIAMARCVHLSDWKGVARLSGRSHDTDNSNTDWIRLWQHIYGFCAAQRLGDKDSERQFEHSALAMGVTLGSQVAAACLDIELASALMGRGLFRTAARQMQTLALRMPEAARLIAKDAHWQSRLTSVWGTSLQALGEYPQSLEILDQMEKGFVGFRPQNILFTWVRRRISLAVEQEDYATATKLLSQYYDEVSDSKYSVTAALLIHEKIRISLQNKSVRDTRRLLTGLEQSVSLQGLAKSFLSLTDVKIELDILDNKPLVASKNLKLELLGSQKRGDLAAQCACYLASARLALMQGLWLQAIQEVEICIAIALEQGYRKVLLRAHLCLAGIYFSQGKSELCTYNLRVCVGLNNELRLPVHSVCLQVVRALTADKTAVKEIIQPLLLAPGGLNQMMHTLNLYGFLEEIKIQGNGKPEVKLESFVPLVLRQKLIAVFLNLGFMVSYVNAKPVLFDFLGKDSLHILVRYLFQNFSATKGFTIQDIHTLFYPRVVFRPDAHRPRMHTLISRLRKSIPELDVHFDPKLDLYFCLGLANAEYAKANVLFHNVTGAHLSVREQQVLDLIRTSGSLETAALCLHFSCTRQTLHPILKKLEKLCLIAMRRKGPKSVYWAL